MFKYLLAFILLANVSCSVNILENFADKNTNEALFYAAKIKVDQGDFAGALAKIELMTDTYRAGRGIKALEAQAHAGICGLNFFDLVLALGNLGTTRILPFMVTNFRGGSDTTKIDECIEAETLIKSIGAVGARTLDENLLMTLVSFAKIGSILSVYTDSDQDGTATAAYDICSNGASPAMPDTYARELGTGITLAIEGLAAISGEVDVASGTLDDISSSCASAPPGFDFCTKTTAGDFTANEILAVRSFVREGSAYGLDLNGCSGGSVSGSAACRCF